MHDEPRPQVTVTRPGSASAVPDVLVAGDERRRRRLPGLRLPRWSWGVLAVVAVLFVAGAAVVVTVDGGAPGERPRGVLVAGVSSVEAAGDAVVVDVFLEDPRAPYLVVSRGLSGRGIVPPDNDLVDPAQRDPAFLADGGGFLNQASSSSTESVGVLPTCGRQQQVTGLVLGFGVLRADGSQDLVRVPVPDDRLVAAVASACRSFSSAPPVAVRVALAGGFDDQGRPTSGSRALAVTVQVARRVGRVDLLGFSWPGVVTSTLPLPTEVRGDQGAGAEAPLAFDCEVALGVPVLRYRLPDGTTDSVEAVDDFGQPSRATIAALRRTACGP